MKGWPTCPDCRGTGQTVYGTPMLCLRILVAPPRKRKRHGSVSNNPNPPRRATR